MLCLHHTFQLMSTLKRETVCFVCHFWGRKGDYWWTSFDIDSIRASFCLLGIYYVPVHKIGSARWICCYVYKEHIAPTDICFEVNGNFIAKLTTNQTWILTMIGVNQFLLLMLSLVCNQTAEWIKIIPMQTIPTKAYSLDSVYIDSQP